jgi:hypothetical protein
MDFVGNKPRGSDCDDKIITQHILPGLAFGPFRQASALKFIFLRKIASS